MEMLWFYIVAVMVAMYVVLEGFDFGAGILSLFVAKTDGERQAVLSAIGPLWDGNEVWLLAGGGALFFAFPKAYASGFSGFYLPLTMVLWLLVIRNLSIEFRNKEESPLWRSFFDGAWFLSSTLMAIVLGAALGNVVRGVPLNSEGYFSGPLFTNFLPDKNPGVLDWYTVAVGVFALAILGLHGALFLRMKVSGEVGQRSGAIANALWIAGIPLFAVATVATATVRPDFFPAVMAHPLSLVLGVVFVACYAGIKVLMANKNEALSFLSSCLFIATMLAASAAAVFPVLLHSSINSADDITAINAHTSQLSMTAGLIVWVVAIVAVVFYFVHLFKTFDGKVSPEDNYGH